ncbi:undecaprenyl-phosphate glucose phosphotransferase [Anaerosporobacter sp.]|uniref:undecaprenyl-phosphate glucose phosphotransferase n=1 Tax=Anaerosporobacter sp. TaxID=1872529 RepID=UPI00286F66E3|nr:undecaprenyl-phosphate glucose phosphotransferase [Anaerosporobacter sp.]
MIKDNQKTFNKFHGILDLIALFIAYSLSYVLRFIIFKPDKGFLPWSTMLHYFVYLLPAYCLIYYSCNLYTPKRSKGQKMELLNILKSNIIGTIYFILVLYIFKKDINVSRSFITIFFAINITIMFLYRRVLVKVLHSIRKHGFNLKHILIVGYSRTAEGYIDRIRANPQWGYHVLGILDDNKEEGEVYDRVKVLGDTSKLTELLAENDIDEIAITLSISEYAKLEDLVTACEKSGVHTLFIPDYNNIIPTRPYIEDLNGLPIINIRRVPLSNTFNKGIKRCIDIFGALVALLIFSIPMLLVTIAIKTTSKGPLIYSQVRIGLHNKEFKMFKFRSMETQTESAEKKAWTTSNDPRVTPIGKFIRKTSIDELPQLFNVLRGEMSLIGPRPERPYFVEKFKEEIPRYMIKHQVRPGLTGWAQVNGYRGDTSIRKRIDHDLYYIENWTLNLDIKILFLTFFKGFINKNAY